MRSSHLQRPLTPPAAPVVFGPREAQIFGWYHAPRGGEAPSAVVVLCNPLDYEAICAHRTYRALAERLADEGLAALRFDYPGTGDSSGDDGAPGRMAAAIGSIHAAIDEARAWSGAEETAVFGVRMGATLAAVAAAARGGVDSAALWAPCATGAAYVRQVRVVARAGGQPPAPGDDQGVAGFRLTEATVAELLEIDLAALTAPPARRALVVPRAGVAAADERLAGGLTALGTDTRVVARDGYSAMMLDPHESILPAAVLDAVVAWLTEAHPRAVPRPHGGAPRPVEVGALSASPPGFEPASVLESPARFGPGGRLFGIVAQPRGPEAEGRRPTLGAVLVSVGAIHRIGPGRLYVTLARTLAALGVPTLRFDLSGIGDSPPAPGEDDNALYARGAGADVTAAMDRLAEESGVTRFVLIGLCSGAHAAYESARADARAAGLWLVNMPVFEWHEGDAIGGPSSRAFKSNEFYGRAFLRLDTWGRVLRGEVRAAQIARVLTERIARSAIALGDRLVARGRGSSAEGAVARAWSAMCARGTDVLLVYGVDEPGVDEARSHAGAAQRLPGGARLRLHTIAGADHTFASRAARSRLMELLTAYVRGRAACLGGFKG